MQASIFLARLLGPLLLLPGLGMLLTPRLFKTMGTELVGSLTLIYLFGLIDLASGLAIVLTHNVWVANWRVIITLIGWLMLIRGAVRILLADRIMPYAKKLLGNKRLLPVSGGIMVLLGLVLCYFGYVA
ncbi:MAG TPA: hypothetical protein VE396_00940 [Xanthobacteraceae bacterium]|nr:hypothetical protein [Xanthobacteraceae bacterium]